MSNTPRTVAIKYGWAEGPWHAKRFAHELEKKGCTLVDDETAADIVFAHSSGCYQVPKNSRAKLILLVGLPYGTAHHLATGVARKLIKEFEYHRDKKELLWWAGKVIHNGWYVASKPEATYYVLKKHKFDNLPSSSGRRVILVRPSDDVLMHWDVDTLLAGMGYELIEIPGSHDSCWTAPQAYVDLMIAR